MSQLTDQLDAVKQSVLELEQQVVGASPLAAQIQQQQNEVQTYAAQLLAKTTEVEEREKALNERETLLVDRENKLSVLKDELKAEQSATAHAAVVHAQDTEVEAA